MHDDDILVAKGLVMRFGGVLATDHADLSVRRGEIHALIGPNGAGKTTLMAQLAGSLFANEGAIYFDGKNVTRLPMHERVALGMVRSFQITNIFKNDFTVLDNICLAVQRRSGSSYRFWRPLAKDSAIEAEARHIISTVGLQGREQTRACELSHGQQRFVEIALALATQAKILFLDEPMAGVSHDESREMTRLLLQLKGQHAIVIVEHDMQAVFALADRISVLVYGKVIATGTPADIKANPEVQRAYLGDEVPA